MGSSSKSPSAGEMNAKRTRKVFVSKILKRPSEGASSGNHNIDVDPV